MSTTPPRIVLVPPSAKTGELAQSLAPSGFELVLAPDSGPELMRAVESAQFMVCYPNVKMEAPFYRTATNLKLVQLLSAGYDAVDIEAARAAGVPVCNNGGANAISVAEHAIMLMLTVSRRVIWQHASVRGGRWRGWGSPTRRRAMMSAICASCSVRGATPRRACGQRGSTASEYCIRSESGPQPNGSAVLCDGVVWFDSGRDP